MYCGTLLHTKHFTFYASALQVLTRLYWAGLDLTGLDLTGEDRRGQKRRGEKSTGDKQALYYLDIKTVIIVLILKM